MLSNKWALYDTRKVLLNTHDTLTRNGFAYTFDFIS